MKNILVMACASLLLASCNNAATDTSKEALNAASTKAETTSKSVVSKLQGSIDNMFNSFEVLSLKAEPERARPVWDRAVKVKDYYKTLEAYLNGLKSSMPGQDKAAFGKTRDELASHIVDADKFVGGLLDTREQNGTRNYLVVKDTAGMQPANAAAIINLMLIDMKTTEYYAISAILGR